jgi:hypothetical protein
MMAAPATEILQVAQEEIARLTAENARLREALMTLTKAVFRVIKFRGCPDKPLTAVEQSLLKARNIATTALGNLE